MDKSTKLKTIVPQVMPYIGQDEVKAVTKTLTDNWITEGKVSAQFIDMLNEKVGVKYGVLAPNGTLALTLGLLALGIGPGDEVMVPNITFIGSATAVILAGATPIFVEVDATHFLIDISKALGKLTSRTKAIMPVHLYGYSCDMDQINQFCERYDLLCIEDAAQGMGVYSRSKHVGSQSDVGCFSFFADKTITTGEGGYICTNDENMYERLLMLRNQGRKNRGSFVHPAIGFNFRMTDMQSAVGVEQLKKLDEIISNKQRLWNLYCDHLDNLPLRVIKPPSFSNIVPFRTIIETEEAKELENYLEMGGVQVRKFFYPLHKQPCFQNMARNLDEYVISSKISEKGLCLPLFPTMSEDQVLHVTNLIIDFYQSS